MAQENSRRLQLFKKILIHLQQTSKAAPREMLHVLQESKEQHERILNRLRNLGAIVASEAWDAIRAGDDNAKVNLLLEDEDKKEPNR